MKEATIEAKQGGERGITGRSVKKVTAVSSPSHVQLVSSPQPPFPLPLTPFVDILLSQDTLAKFKG